MPSEPLKAVVQSPGFFGASIDILKWFFGALGAGAVVVWGNITGRIKVLESTLVTHTKLEEHIDSEEKQFTLLFSKHDEMNKSLTVVREAVARIEGKLSSNHDWQDSKDGR